MGVAPNSSKSDHMSPFECETHDNLGIAYFKKAPRSNIPLDFPFSFLGPLMLFVVFYKLVLVGTGMSRWDDPPMRLTSES